jgi:predicted dinucleotide-binding enzyme
MDEKFQVGFCAPHESAFPNVRGSVPIFSLPKQMQTKKLRDAGYPVKMANAKGRESLRDLAAKTGAIPVSVEQVVQDVDILVIVVLQKSIPELPKGLLNKAKKETIVIDVGNYYPARDGRIDEIENGLTDSAWVEKQIGRPVVKVLNSILSKALAAAGRPAGSKDRVALPISGDNPKAREIVAQLIDQIGFDSVDAGTIAESWRQQTWISCLLHQSDEGGTSVLAKKRRPFFTCRRPGEGVEGIL